MQRKAVFLDSDNRLKEILPGDTLEGAVAAHSFAATNGNAGTIVKGAPVYQNGTNDEIDLARANADGTMEVCGLVADTSVLTGASAMIQTDGILVATTLEWDAIVTGASGGLVAGTRYMLDPDTAGKLRPFSDTIDAGEWRVPVGKAISTTDMLIKLGEPVKRN